MEPDQTIVSIEKGITFVQFSLLLARVDCFHRRLHRIVTEFTPRCRKFRFDLCFFSSILSSEFDARDYTERLQKSAYFERDVILQTFSSCASMVFESMKIFRHMERYTCSLIRSRAIENKHRTRYLTITYLRSNRVASPRKNVFEIRVPRSIR